MTALHASPSPARVVRLASETDLAGWRAAARGLRSAGIPPEGALWTVDAGAGAAVEPHGDASFTVPRGFLELAEQVILHRSDERFGLLYRLLWRLQDEPDLLRRPADPDVARARQFAQAVAKAVQTLKAFARFREVDDDQGEAWVAWFEPAHRVAEVAAPFFARRFARTRFWLLTPDVCVRGDLGRLSFAPGADPADAPSAEGLEAYWRAHCARNPGAGGSIPRERTPPMVRQTPIEPSDRAVRAARRASRDAPFDGQAPASLEEVWAGVDACRRCDLWRCGAGVAGEGPGHARLMFVGEQPGDQEERARRPFVGPAGQVLDRALAEAGVPRTETFVTNAVKHFKHEVRGKRRLHKTPDAGEVTACRWWLESERRIVRPRVIVALGATAALSVFGKPTPIGKFRQQALQLPDQAQGVVTYHPSYLLRVPDKEAKARAYALFVEDLRFAWKLAA